VPIFYFITFVELPALAFLAFWFLLQLLSGLASLGVETSAGGVAYGAHVGGFLLGAIIALLLPRSARTGRARSRRR
jgi:membrane associated rhomboid family serine protease